MAVAALCTNTKELCKYEHVTEKDGTQKHKAVTAVGQSMKLLYHYPVLWTAVVAPG